jgi:ribosomal protein S27AE
MERTAAMACPNCGSWAVKADRSLAGRMVCARCGQVLGLGAKASVTARTAGHRRGGLRTFRWRWRWGGWLGVALLVAVSALLASQAPPRSPSPETMPTPRGRPSAPI